MSETGRRVALLARPGVACDRLREALAQAGAELVLEANPLDLEPAALESVQAEVLMIALDAATEDALDRFDGPLQDPGVEVIFEEADVVIRREGWEAARWVRHLAAKLHRHADVLPPGAEPDGVEPEAPAWAPAAPADAVVEGPPPGDTEAGTRVATASAAHPFDPVAADSASTAPATTQVAAMQLEGMPRDEFALEGMPLEGMQLERMAWEGEASSDTVDAMPGFQSATTGEDAGAHGDGSTVAAFDASGFDPVAFEQATVAEPVDVTPFSLDQTGDLALDDLRAEPSAATHDAGFDRLVDHDFTDAAPAGAAGGVSLPMGDRFAGVPAGAEPAATAATPARVLSLVDDEADDASAHVRPPASDTTAVSDDRFKHDLVDLELRIASLELVDDRPAPQDPKAAAATGVVLILAGIGGPDAVRQLLGALPADFARPVIVQQRLDGGRYDKLVAQMQRATTLPVKLAESGAEAAAGAIYILPAQTGFAVAPAGVRFTDDAGDLLACVPPADSAVLMLSGSDAAQVDAVMTLSGAGALVGGQATEGCYDAAAPSALIARGGTSGTPVELARRLAQRWAS